MVFYITLLRFIKVIICSTSNFIINYCLILHKKYASNYFENDKFSWSLLYLDILNFEEKFINYAFIRLYL